jgi:hypothetical protein
MTLSHLSTLATSFLSRIESWQGVERERKKKEEWKWNSESVDESTFHFPFLLEG